MNAEAEAIANSRKPDKIAYGDWEPDPESRYVETYTVPVAGGFLSGFTYKTVEVEKFRRVRRKVYEYWYEKAWLEPVIRPITLADYSESVTAESSIDVIAHEAKTVGRWYYDYENSVLY
jgi:hypothetical protein